MSTIQSGTRRPILTARAADIALRRYAASQAAGRRLAWCREAAGVSQAALGGYLGVSRYTVHNIEHGLREMRPTEVIAAARALGCSIATFTAPTIALPPASTNGTRKAAAA